MAFSLKPTSPRSGRRYNHTLHTDIGAERVMYAIFEDGSRQYRAEEGALIVLDYRDVKPGDTLELNKVLLYSDGGTAKVGQPLISGARVVAEVVDLPKKKTVIQKFKRRKNYRRLKGHTQPHVRVRVKQIIA